MATPEGRAARVLLAGVVGAVALLLAACAGIPTSGPVYTGGGFANERSEPITRLIAQPPRPGMSEQAVVAGFLSASGSFDDDHAVAREFLTDDAARTWNAAAGVRVYDSQSAVVYGPPTGGRMLVTATQIGAISGQGEFEAAPARSTIKAEFRLVREQGEWRISALAQGLLLDRDGMQRAYRTYNLYFLDQTSSVLVPQPVLVPIGPGLSTSLVSALLKGPAPWLEKAARTAVPTGTKLVVGSVPVRDGVAQVDLTSQAAAVAGAQASALSAQLVWTLRQITDVTSVRLTVESVPMRVPGAGDVQGRDSWPTFDPAAPGAADPVFLRKGRVQQLRDGRAVEVPGQVGDGSVPLAHPAVAFDGTYVAGLSTDGRRLLVGRTEKDDKLAVVVSGGALTPPSWDRLGAVWTIDESSSVAWQVKPGSAPVAVPVRDRPAGRVVALRLARDGVRAAVLVQIDGRTQLYLARVERAEGQLALSGFRALGTGFADTTDVAWASADRLLVLGRTSATAVPQPVVVGLGGAVSSLAPLAAASAIVSVTAAPSEAMLAATADGKLWTYNGFDWDGLDDGSAPAYPG